MNPTTPIIIPLQNTITPPFTHKGAKTMKSKNIRNQKEKTIIGNKKLHTET